jgi:two-component system, OmpR family, response regulator
MRVLIVEDDPMIGKALRTALRDEAMTVDWVREAGDAEHALAAQNYALILLDIGLPGRNGLDLLNSLRASGKDLPILIISAQDELDSRVCGLDQGADDYLVKPFEIRELLARIRAVIRRRHGGQAVSELTAGEITLDLNSHQMSYRGIAQPLPAKEFALLRTLMERPGAVLSRTQLEEQLYGWGEEVESNAIDVLIHYIRRKFGKDVILNMRGVGWKIDKAAR